MLPDTKTIPSGFDYQPQSVNGKSILVTGGTTGIGRATALLLASQGAQVMIFGRHEKELKEALNDMRHAGKEVKGMMADVSRPEDIQRIFKDVDQQLGRLDVLVNNAALSAQDVSDMEYSNMEYVVSTNLLGYMGCSREAIQRMKNNGGGHIVNIGSMSADVRESGSSVYVATKAGIQGFSEALRKEINPQGIKVSLIEPGAVGTNMQSGSSDDFMNKAAEGQMLMAEDIALAVLFCLMQPPRSDVVSLQIRPHQQAI